MALVDKYAAQWSSEPGKMCFAHYGIAGSVAAFILAFFIVETIWWPVIFPTHVALTILHLVVGLCIDIRLEEVGKWL